MKKDFNLRMGQRIRGIRESYGYTREEVAELAGISVAFVRDIEIGKKGMTAMTLSKLCHALKVSADYLIFGHEDDALISQMLVRLTAEEKEKVEKLLQNTIKIVKLAKS